MGQGVSCTVRSNIWQQHRKLAAVTYATNTDSCGMLCDVIQSRPHQRNDAIGLHSRPSDTLVHTDQSRLPKPHVYTPSIRHDM
jgi:hypothetical protein